MPIFPAAAIANADISSRSGDIVFAAANCIARNLISP